MVESKRLFADQTLYEIHVVPVSQHLQSGPDTIVEDWMILFVAQEGGRHEMYCQY